MNSVTRWIGLPFRVVRGVSKAVLALVLLASLALNLAMVTVSGVHAAVSAAVSAVGVGTVAAREAAHRVAVRTSARKATERVTRRAAVRTARNSASAFGEAVPVLGVAVIAGALALEVKDACDTAEDMAALEAMLAGEGDPEAAAEAARAAFDCRAALGEAVDVPSGAEIWQGVARAPAAALERAGQYYDGLPAFSLAGVWAGIRDFVGGVDPVSGEALP